LPAAQRGVILNAGGIVVPESQKLILEDVPWDVYTRLLRTFEERHLRLTYDRGRLEIMTLCHERESLRCILGRFAITLTEELNLPIRGGGSTTLRSRKKKKAIEPDDSFWIAHEADIRNNKVINLRNDPPPDLALEVNIPRSSINRMRIYAALNVPEVWRWDKNGLGFSTLNANGKYESVAVSPTFPLPISPADLLPFIAMREQMDDNAVIRQFRAWIRNKRAASQP
jgi:Uma2 family endonuclease